MSKKDVTLEDIQDWITREVYGLYYEYDMDEMDMVDLIDSIKQFADIYSRLLVEGKIPKEKQYTQDPVKALDLINRELAKVGKEL